MSGFTRSRTHDRRVEVVYCVLLGAVFAVCGIVYVMFLLSPLSPVTLLNGGWLKVGIVWIAVLPVFVAGFVELMVLYRIVANLRWLRNARHVRHRQVR